MRCLLLLGLGGCHVLFPLENNDGTDAPGSCTSDLDDDGECDDVDSCLAPESDLTADIDEDDLADDPCPLIRDDMLLGDADMDDYDDRCDPHISTVAPDRSLCTMAFTDPAFTARLWLPRSTEGTWIAQVGELEAQPDPGETVTAIAAVPIAGKTETTFEVLAEQSNLQIPGNFTLWLRADPEAPNPTDAGCQLVLEQVPDRSTLVVVPTGASAPMAIMFEDLALIRLRGSIIEGPTTTTISCFVAYTARSGVSDGDTTSVEVTDSVTVNPEGRIGLSSLTWRIRVAGLQISDRGP